MKHIFTVKEIDVISDSVFVCNKCSYFAGELCECSQTIYSKLLVCNGHKFIAGI